jgi:hypothetical protein
MVETYKKEIEMLKAGSTEKEGYLHSELTSKTQKIEALEHEIVLLKRTVDEQTT